MLSHAEGFQNEVKHNLYDKFIVNTYGGAAPGFYGTVIEGTTEGFDASRATVPQLNYRHTTLSEALQAEWIDILVTP